MGKQWRGAVKTLNLGQILGKRRLGAVEQCARPQFRGKLEGATPVCWTVPALPMTGMVERPSPQDLEDRDASRGPRPPPTQHVTSTVDPTMPWRYALTSMHFRETIIRDSATLFLVSLTPFAPTLLVLMLTMLTPPNFVELVAPHHPL